MDWEYATQVFENILSIGSQYFRPNRGFIAELSKTQIDLNQSFLLCPSVMKQFHSFHTKSIVVFIIRSYPHAVSHQSVNVVCVFIKT